MTEALIALVFGLLIGSFLNVCIYRWPLDLSVVRPRSHCVACNSTIAWYDNIPLISFAVLRGRCRQCAAPISWRYPIVEDPTMGFRHFPRRELRVIEKSQKKIRTARRPCRRGIRSLREVRYGGLMLTLPQCRRPTVIEGNQLVPVHASSLQFRM